MAPRSCCSRVTTFNHSVSTLLVIGYASCVLSLRYVLMTWSDLMTYLSPDDVPHSRPDDVVEPDDVPQP